MDEFADMDEDERREAIKDAVLDPDDYNDFRFVEGRGLMTVTCLKLFKRYNIGQFRENRLNSALLL